MNFVGHWGSDLSSLNLIRNSDQLRSLADPARRLLHNSKLNPSTPFGCNQCPHYDLCGGLNIEAQIWDCLDFCCGHKNGCDRVCRNNKLFATQFNEIGSFDLLTVPNATATRFIPSNTIVPTIYHSTARKRPASAKTVALRFSDLYNFKTGEVRFKERSALCETFQIRLDSEIILIGIDHDRRIEPWWRLGSLRLEVIKNLKELGVDLVTTPNFSMILDRPRMDDLHAMKRIAIVHEEFCSAGLPTALHVNGRTDRDFERWTEFLIERPNISQISFEFSTGNKRPDRLPLYVKWLCELANKVDRPIDIFLRGDPKSIPLLRGSFKRVIYVETTAFMCTTKRRRATRIGNNKIDWIKYPTEVGADLADLFDYNFDEQAAWLSSAFFLDAA